MGTTAEKLAKLNETKVNIRAAIREKGKAVSDTDTFASYADKIRAIASPDSSIPFEVSSEAEMNQILSNATPDMVGAVYRYVGETTVAYETNALYIITTGRPTIRFVIGETPYQAEEGMTWEEWCDSIYNKNGFYYGGITFRVYLMGDICVAHNGILEHQGNPIIANASYELAESDA